MYLRNLLQLHAAGSAEAQLSMNTPVNVNLVSNILRLLWRVRVPAVNLELFQLQTVHARSQCACMLLLMLQRGLTALPVLAWLDSLLLSPLAALQPTTCVKVLQTRPVVPVRHAAAPGALARASGW